MVAGGETAVEGRAEVGELLVRPVGPFELARAVPLGVHAAGGGQVVVAVPADHEIALAELVQPVTPVVPDGVEHAVVIAHPRENGLRRERGEHGGYVGQAFVLADAAGGLDVEGTREDRQTGPEQAFGGSAQLVTPARGGAQRVVADEEAVTVGQQLEPVVELVGELDRGQAAHVAGRQLDGERHAVEPAAEPGDGHHGPFVRAQPGGHGLRAVQEETHRVVAGEVGGLGRGDGKGVDDHDDLQGEAELLAAGGDDPDVGRMRSGWRRSGRCRGRPGARRCRGPGAGAARRETR